MSQCELEIPGIKSLQQMEDERIQAENDYQEYLRQQARMNYEMREDLKRIARAAQAEIETIEDILEDPENKIHPIICMKCGARSGDNWLQCGGKCPMEGSPHYTEGLKYEPFYLRRIAHARELEMNPPMVL